MMARKDDILDRIAREEACLADLDRARQATQARLASLKSALDAVSLSSAPLPESSASTDVPQTPADKVRLFLSLFQGRPDVFPTRFVSTKTGKAGYSPACANKWAPGLCALRAGGKCGDCANQAFVPVSEQVVRGHLQGRHVMGVYPLLADETCHFLAVDFDKRAWRRDVAALRETCDAVGVPVAIERSRSGEGAHAWFFFTAPVAANVARRMGCYLITETMSRRHELSMDSYDRLFPNQDTMPRGGFGNLIALPLQHEPRQAGNSVFVDERLEPFGDQWAFLAAVSRIKPTAAEAIAREASQAGRVVGVRSAEMLDDDTATPWARPPSGRRPAMRIAESLPQTVRGVLAQRLFVEKAGLPSALITELKRLAAFQNPDFYKKQKMRLSTALTPRVISRAEELPQFVALPRGCATAAAALVAGHGADLSVEDERELGAPLEVEFTGELTDVQAQAARALLAHDTGVFVGPPGIGKTVLGTYLIAERARSTLVLVHRKHLLEQWLAQLAMFLNLDAKEIGQIGGGKRKPNGRLDVATLQSLVNKEVDERVAGYGQVIVDECHHLSAVSFERVLSEVKARFVVGLTATPQRRDGHHPITEMQIGPVRHKVDVRSQAARRPFEHKLIVRETAFEMTEGDAAGIQEIYAALAHDGARNRRILDDVIAALEEGRSPILLTERKDHLEHLAEELRPFVRHVVVLRGGMSGKARRTAADKLAAIPDDEERLVLATGRYIGEGFDDARLDTLFLAMPISWKGTLIQYSGRLHRRHARKTEVRIYDYVDRAVPMLVRMFEKRLRTYRAIGYARGEAPLGFGEPPEETVVEYDEEALRHFETDF
jgi:superfamily II DNA or RNA helicase